MNRLEGKKVYWLKGKCNVLSRRKGNLARRKSIVQMVRRKGNVWTRSKENECMKRTRKVSS